jgi:HlyD family secretion protein
VDRALPKKKWTQKRILSIAGITGIVFLIGASYYFTSGKSRLNVETERITISEIKMGTFQESIPVNGIVMPVSTIYLDAAEGGRVEEKYVEDGAIMKKGEPILRLSNTDLELSLVNQETSVFNLLTQMQISRNAASQNTISKLNQMADVENAFKEAERLYKLNKKLYDQRVIGSQEFEQSRIAYDYQVKRKKLTEQILRQDSVSNKQEMDQTAQSYERTRNALAVMRKKVDDLIVRAPVDGQLTSLDAEIGQSKSKGERLGQIDVLSGFKIRADIDEHYISRIFTGLMADYTMGGKTYALTIKKVYTQVTNGRFQVDMEYSGEVPTNIRRGQSLQIRVTLSDAKQSLLLPRGGFYQQTGGNWIFKLNKDGSIAYKTDIQLGGQNPDYYEVLEGLQAGDRVITSGYDNYGEIEELVLKGG